MKYKQYSADTNPARQFYRHWKRALDVTGFRSLTIPGTSWGYWHEIICGQPVIGLGTVDGQWAHLRVAADGRFFLRDVKAGWGYGMQRRQKIENNSFLYFCGGWSEYLWMVRAGDDGSYPWQRVRDPADRIQYVGENLLTWGYSSGVWQELVKNVDGEWQMRPARRQESERLAKSDYDRLLKRHDDYQARVAKRYERIERQRLGIPPKVSAETLRLREERREALLDEHTHQLAALLDVSMPAKTERYTRPKEAPHDHTVADQDPV